MPPVGSGVNQHIGRLFLKAALNQRLQVFVFHLKILETQVIHINDKLVIPVFELGDHRVQILKLMLVQFNNTQAFLVIFVGDSLHAGGFARPRVPEQQTVVGASPGHKSLRILTKLLLGNLISHQIIQIHMGNVADRHDPRSLLRMLHTEGFVQSQISHTVLSVKLGERRFHGRSVLILHKVLRQRTDPVADTPVIDLTVRRSASVSQHHGKLRRL